MSVDEKLAGLRAAHARMGELLDELAVALQFKALWPEIYAGGGFSATVIGPPKQPAKTKLLLRRADGEERTWTFAELPPDIIHALLPSMGAEERAEVERWLKKRATA